MTYSTRAGRDFMAFLNTMKDNGGWWHRYETETARSDFVFENNNSAETRIFSFVAMFFQDRFCLSIQMRKFDVPEDRRAEFSKALILANARNADFSTFSYAPETGLTTSMVVLYNDKKRSLELIRKAYLSVWRSALIYFDVLTDAAKGVIKSQAEMKKRFRREVGYFATVFTDVVGGYIWSSVSEFLESLKSWEERLTGDGFLFPRDEGDRIANDSNVDLSATGYEGFLNGSDVEMHGDGFLFPPDGSDDDCVGAGPDPYDEDPTDESDYDSDFKSRFSQRVMGKAFNSESDRRRQEDRRILEQDDDSKRDNTDDEI